MYVGKGHTNRRKDLWNFENLFGKEGETLVPLIFLQILT